MKTGFRLVSDAADPLCQKCGDRLWRRNGEGPWVSNNDMSLTHKDGSKHVAGKISKDAADYKHATNLDHSCDTCFFMHEDGTCGKVEGIVQPDMVCRLWEDT